MEGERVGTDGLEALAEGVRELAVLHSVHDVLHATLTRLAKERLEFRLGCGRVRRGPVGYEHPR